MKTAYHNIPPLLLQHHHWVVWGIQGAPLKAPFQPRALLKGQPEPAKAGVPTTWGRYDDALRCVEQGLAQGIGYEFSGDGLYGIDLDHVLDDKGHLTPQAQEIVDKLASYTERSPSGTGLHIFVFAGDADIKHHRKKNGFVEIYSEGRYFTVTGETFGGPRPIEHRSQELQEIHDTHLTPDDTRRIVRNSLPAIHDEAGHFLRIGLERDKVFAALWAGERRHGNESADDQALMHKLAYWCNADPSSMIYAFLSSPHHAQKDNAHKKKCQRADYLSNTAARASTTVYSTAQADHERWLQQKKTRRKGAR